MNHSRSGCGCGLCDKSGEFWLSLSVHGLVLVTPLFGLTVSFMRPSVTRCAVETGVQLHWDREEQKVFGWLDWKRSAGFLWRIGLKELRMITDGELIHFEKWSD